jgi:hypothetical protein
LGGNGEWSSGSSTPSLYTPIAARFQSGSIPGRDFFDRDVDPFRLVVAANIERDGSIRPILARHVGP